MSAALVKELRERTGLGLLECKKALAAVGGDVELAEVDIQRCEGSFLSGLAPAARRAYDAERAACRSKYAKREGTMYVSFAVTCEAGVAARYAGAAEKRTRSR